MIYKTKLEQLTANVELAHRNIKSKLFTSSNGCYCVKQLCYSNDENLILCAEWDLLCYKLQHCNVDLRQIKITKGSSNDA